MVWTSPVRGRFKGSLQVGEKDVAAAAQAGGSEKLETEAFEYQLQPVVLIVPKGSAPALVEARRKEAEALRTRVQTCAEANALFKTMQNAAIRDVVTKTSADIPAVLREVLDKTPVGHLTAPEQTKQGVEMVALCGRKPTTVDTPKKGNPGQDVCREVRGEVEIVPAGSPQGRDDRISLMHGRRPSPLPRRTGGYRAGYHPRRPGAAAMN